MVGTKELIRDARHDIDNAVDLVSQSMRLVEILEQNGYADSTLATVLTRESQLLVKAMRRRVRNLKADLLKAEVRHHLVGFRADMATIQRTLN